MKRFFQSTTAIALGLAGSAHAAEIMVTSDIATSTTWSSDNTYNLQDQIYVLPGATLTIEAGTVVASTTNVGGSLAVARGAQIFVNGTADNPVIMTSTSDVATWSGGDPKTGVWREAANEWGNLTIMGSGFISENAVPGNAPTCNAGNRGAMEGLIAGGPGDPNVLYGGGDDDDDSGSIHYLSKRYGGRVIGLNNELNGLSLGGIGRGTDISHVEIMNNVDDGVEIWGGAVNLKYISIWNVGDDSFDVDQGWRGKAQFVLIVQGHSLDASQGSGVGDNAFETDGAEDASWQPVTTTTIYNATVIGQPSDGDHATAWRDNARVQYRNCLFSDIGARLVSFDNIDGDGANGYGFDGTLSWPATWTTDYNAVPAHANDCPPGTYQAQGSGKLAEITDSVFFNIADVAEATARGVFAASNNNVSAMASCVTSITRGPAIIRGGKIMEPVTFLDPRPVGDAATSVASAPSDGFFTSANYRGAFAPNGAPWTCGWTASEAFGFTAGDCGIGTSYCTASLNSTGAGAVVSAAGSSTASALNLSLTAQPVPNTPGLFFFGPSQLGNEPGFGEGVRCVGGATRRVFPLTGGSGNVATSVLNGNAGYASSIVSGASLNFQYWFRETMNAGDLDGDGMVEPFNTSNALNIVFQ